jgi:hypothetical protein
VVILRERWRAELIQARGITADTKVLLLVLADEMRGDGYVCVPRDQLAKTLGRHPARITERIREAITTGWLAEIVKGKPGTTACYRATLGPVDGKRVSTKRNRLNMVRAGAPTLGAGVRTATRVRAGAPSGHAQHGAGGQSAYIERERSEHVVLDGLASNDTTTTSAATTDTGKERNDEEEPEPRQTAVLAFVRDGTGVDAARAASSPASRPTNKPATAALLPSVRAGERAGSELTPADCLSADTHSGGVR